MNLAISNIAWLKSEDSIVYSLMRKYDYTGLEIAPTRLFDNPYDVNSDDIKQCKKNIKSHGISVVAMQSLHYGKDEIALFEGIEKRKSLYEYTKKAIEFGSIIGAKALVFGSPKLRSTNSPADYKIGVEFFRKLGEFALEKNVFLLIEANPIQYNTNFINTTGKALQLVEDVNSFGFGMHLDTSTMILNAFTDYKIIENAFEKIKHVHISSPFLHGVDKINDKLYRNLAAILDKNGYSEYISIEMRRKEENNISNIESCLQYVSDIFAQ